MRLQDWLIKSFKTITYPKAKSILAKLDPLERDVPIVQETDHMEVEISVLKLNV